MALPLNKLVPVLRNDVPLKVPVSVIAELQQSRPIIQDFTPLADCIDWQLGRLYFQYVGTDAFSSSTNGVPFSINNDGNMSICAAHVLMASLLAADAKGLLPYQVYILELGIGSGLFARFFLDAFMQLCKRKEVDYYDRLIYIAADNSARMLSDLQAGGALARHAGHVRFALVDALHIADSDLFNPKVADPPVLWAVFANYVLDCLPAALLRFGGDEASQLFVRTCLARGVDPKEFAGLDLEEIIRRVEARTPQFSKRELINLYPLFVLQHKFMPTELGRISHGDFALSYKNGHTDCFLFNHGAIECLDTILRLLNSSGFIIVNDYGSTDTSVQDSTEMLPQHFAGSVAVGLNFHVLREFVSGWRRYRWVGPKQDNAHIFSRLIGKEPLPETTAEFERQFDKAKFDALWGPEKRAEELYRHGCPEAALSAISEALSRQPYNWRLMSQAATFLTQLGDHDSGLELSRNALALNPNGRSEPWNALGECLLGLNRVDEAEEAFQCALAVDQEDVRGHLNLATIHLRRGDCAAALSVIALGLGIDQGGQFRELLLRRQAEVLERIGRRYTQQYRGAIDRNFKYMENS